MLLLMVITRSVLTALITYALTLWVLNTYVKVRNSGVVKRFYVRRIKNKMLKVIA